MYRSNNLAPTTLEVYLQFSRLSQIRTSLPSRNYISRSSTRVLVIPRRHGIRPLICQLLTSDRHMFMVKTIIDSTEHGHVDDHTFIVEGPPQSVVLVTNRSRDALVVSRDTMER
ncbi:unnamed protein product [Peniophora sp. CBMAI 1063]|nr:unnamed protein product [Peniophora sp. CBMAI 1063]